MTDSEIRNKMKDLPDLPGLETVEPKRNPMPLILFVVGGFIAFYGSSFVMLLMHYGNYVNLRGKVLIILSVGIITGIIFKILFSYHQFKTDVNGLTMIGILHKRFVSWNDVKEASIWKSGTGTHVMVIKTEHDNIKFAPCNYALLASVFQHLRSIGRAENMILPPYSLSFWEPVPDDVPHEAEWSGRSVAFGKAAAVFSVLLYGGFAVAVWFWFPLRLPVIVFTIWLSLVSLIILKWILLPDTLHKAWRVSVRDDYLEAHLPFAKAHIPWTEIESAQLITYNLIIKYGSQNSEIRVPYTSGKKESEDMILAIVRNLRTISKIAINMPLTYLRNRDALYTPAQTSQHRINAFLNTLDPPVKKRISALYYSQFLAILIGCAAAFTAMSTSPLERISRSLHNTPDTLYFLTSTDMWLAFPALIIACIVYAIVINLIGVKMPSPFRETWKELCKVQHQDKFETVVIVLCLAFGTLSLLVCIPAVDNYTRITGNGIAINRFWSLGHEEFHPWNQVKQIIVHEPTNVNTDKIVYEVIFTAGKRWRSDSGNMGLLSTKDLDRAV